MTYHAIQFLFISVQILMSAKLCIVFIDAFYFISSIGTLTAGSPAILQHEIFLSAAAV